MSSNSVKSIYSFHLAKSDVISTLGALLRPPSGKHVSGLQHAECMTVMTLGAPIYSPARMQLRNLAMFAAWESE